MAASGFYKGNANLVFVIFSPELHSFNVQMQTFFFFQFKAWNWGINIQTDNLQDSMWLILAENKQLVNLEPCWISIFWGNTARWVLIQISMAGCRTNAITPSYFGWSCGVLAPKPHLTFCYSLHSEIQPPPIFFCGLSMYIICCISST